MSDATCLFKSTVQTCLNETEKEGQATNISISGFEGGCVCIYIQVYIYTHTHRGYMPKEELWRILHNRAFDNYFIKK